MEKTKKTTSSGQEVRPFANLMMDTAFKISFGKESGGQNMIYLLEKLLPGKHITEIEYTDKEHPGLFLSEKKSIFDLECKAGDESFVVEMQVQKKSSFQDRVLYYSTFLLREQLMTPLELDWGLIQRTHHQPFLFSVYSLLHPLLNPRLL